MFLRDETFVKKVKLQNESWLAILKSALLARPVDIPNWPAWGDLHSQGCSILSRTGLLFPANHTPAKSKVQNLRQKISQRVQAALGLSREALLRQLNPLLRGWANYYRNGVSKQTFAKVDYYVWSGGESGSGLNDDILAKPTAWQKCKYFSASGSKGFFQRSRPAEAPRHRRMA